jgi:hypothetical protein
MWYHLWYHFFRVAFLLIRQFYFVRQHYSLYLIDFFFANYCILHYRTYFENAMRNEKKTLEKRLTLFRICLQNWKLWRKTFLFVKSRVFSYYVQYTFHFSKRIHIYSGTVVYNHNDMRYFPRRSNISNCVRSVRVVKRNVIEPQHFLFEIFSRSCVFVRKKMSVICRKKCTGR